MDDVVIEVARWCREAEAVARDKIARRQLGEAFTEQRPWPQLLDPDRQAQPVSIAA